MVVKGIICIAGHYLDRPGAKSYKGDYEHDYTTLVQREIHKELKKYAVEVLLDDEKKNLTQIVSWANVHIKPGWVIIDIHFNNNIPSASGTEVFIHDKSSVWVRRTASRMANNLSVDQGIPLRRYLHSRDYKYPQESFIGQLGIVERVLIDNAVAPVFLPEICFLNQRDLKNFNPSLVAKSIVKSLDLRVKLTCQDPKTEKRV